MRPAYWFGLPVAVLAMAIGSCGIPSCSVGEGDRGTPPGGVQDLDDGSLGPPDTFPPGGPPAPGGTQKYDDGDSGPPDSFPPGGPPAPEGPGAWRSVSAIPSSIESVISMDFGQVEEFPWLEAFRPKKERAGSWGIPGLSEALLRELLDAGVQRLTLGARRFRTDTTKQGYREEVRVIETREVITDVVLGLEDLAKGEGAVEVEVPFGRLFRISSRKRKEVWIGIGGLKLYLFSTQEDLARNTLFRNGMLQAGRSPPPFLSGIDQGDPFDGPFLLLRRYDRENSKDIFSPLNPPRQDFHPQDRPFRVEGIRVSLGGREFPVADLDVLTEEPKRARRFYNELVGMGTRLEEPPPPPGGWIRFRFESDKDNQAQFRTLMFLLFGYQLR